MKKLLTLFAIALAVIVSSCSMFDDTAIWDKLNEQEQTLNDHEKRITALEELCRQLNTNIDALQTIVEALEKMDYVTNVSPVREDGEIVGYTISFANSDTITIYNGKDGKDGQDGQNGYTPQIGVMKDTDGIYYWTIDGEWLLDDNGNKIKAVGEDGRDGQDGTDGANGNDGQDGTDGKDGITPRLKIENDYWYVSYDEGATWIELGKATGEDGADGSDGNDGDSIFSSVTQDDEYVYFNLADGTIITLPKHDDTEKSVFEIDGEGNYIVEADGGTVVVAVTTNLEYTVKIPTEAQSWISVADTRAVREETLTFNVAKNEDSEERSATVNLCAKGGDILQTITIKQNKSNAISCANNEIIYTTKYGYPIELNITEGFGGNIMSHNFANGYGIISFDNDVVSIPNEAFNGCTTLTTIVLPNSLSTIDYSAFSGCTSLTSITIPDSVTTIGSSAFSGCTSLESITIPDSVTSIRGNAFNNCSGLTSVTIPDSVTTIGSSAFYGCTGELIVNCNIPSATTSESGAFYGADFTKVTIGNSVTKIGESAFAGCTSLTSITIPDSVTKIGKDAFKYCTGELIVNCNIPSATSSDKGAFYGANFTKVTIGDSVTKIGNYAFYDCTSLTSVDITDIEAWCKISFGHSSSNPLTYAHNLYLNGELVTDVVIPDSVTEIGYSAFSGCTSLTSITIPDSVTKIESSAFYGCTGELIVNCNIPSATSSDNGAFYGANFTKVTIGNSVTTIGDYAFSLCTSLTSVDITDIEAWCKISFGHSSSNPLTYAHNLYLNGELVTDVVIPDSVTKIGGYAFYNCTSLTSMTIPESVTSIGSHAFSGCTGELIVNCNIPSATDSSNGAFYGADFTKVTIGDSVTSIGSYAFYNCTSLTSITIPDSVTSIGSYAFSGCTGELIVNCNIPSKAFYGADFTKVTIGDSVTSIGSYAFRGCTSLTSVTIGDSVTTIGDSAFYDCTSLKRFNGKYASEDNRCLIFDGVLVVFARAGLTEYAIPDSVTTIGDSAFEDCTSLTSITIPDSVTSIGSIAFYGCTSLMEVYCKPTTPPMGGYNMFYRNASGRTIYVPRDSVEAYKSASNWSAYAASIVGYVF